MTPHWELWWAQVRAVIRLEMKKTFFAKRGLWVYLLAAMPVLLFLGHAIDLASTSDSRRAMSKAHPVQTSTLEGIEAGMSEEDVIKRVGEPYSRRIFVRRRRGNQADVVFMSYTDGQSEYTFTLVDGEVTGTSRNDGENLQEDTLIFANVFQFFFLRLAIFFGCVGIFMNLFRGEMIDKSLHFYLLAPIRREVLLAGKYLAGLTATVVIFTTSAALQLWMLLLPYDSATVTNYLHGVGWHHVYA